MVYTPINLVANMKENINRIRKMEKEHKHGKMEQNMKANGKIINNMVKVLIQIKMENPKKGFGVMMK